VQRLQLSGKVRRLQQVVRGAVAPRRAADLEELAGMGPQELVLVGDGGRRPDRYRRAGLVPATMTVRQYVVRFISPPLGLPERSCTAVLCGDPSRERAPLTQPTGIAKEGSHRGRSPRHVGAAGTVRGIKPSPEPAEVDGACAAHPAPSGSPGNASIGLVTPSRHRIALGPPAS